jgi:general secretion pathway protein K
MTPPPEEKGVALVTVLLMVAVMSVMAAGVLEEIRFSIRRTANAEAVGQARWYALGAEAVARTQVARLVATGTTSGAWSGRMARYPVEGGEVAAGIVDGGACYNLNSVVEGSYEAYRRSDAGVAQFLSLTRVLGLGQRDGEMLAAALVDWIDTDPLREAGGAEDQAYGGPQSGYLTSGALLAEASELRAIRGFTPAVYARLRPYVCALPQAGVTPININTVPPEKAALIAMLADRPMAAAAARTLIAARPAGGWTREEFLALPAVTDAAIGGDKLTDTSRYFRLETEVTYGDAEAISSALLVNEGGRIRLAARRWGPEE